MESLADFGPYFDANRSGWNLRTDVHRESAFYDVESWKRGRESLTPIELAEMGDVSGKELLHLQCHFGQDTLSWARRGARVTGVDLSDRSIACARSLADETGLDASFVCSNVFDLESALPRPGAFDIVFTSYGVLGWLPTLEPWARVVEHFLKPGGFFYIAEFHPVVWMLDDDMNAISYAYHNVGVIETKQRGTYANREAPIEFVEYGWNHGLGEVVSSLTRVGLHVDFLNEYPYSPFPNFPNSVRGEDGNYRIRGKEGLLPMVYSLRATKKSATPGA